MIVDVVASRATLALALAATMAAVGCQTATELELRVSAPGVSLLNPLSLAVSDLVLKSESDAILAAVSVGANRDAAGRLPFGVLDPMLAGDLRLDVMSGSQLVGLAEIQNTAIVPGERVTLQADIRKPLVFIGADDAPEGAGPRGSVQLLDPTTSTDLATRGIAVPRGQAAAFTTDGKLLLLAAEDGLRAFDTGSGMTAGPKSLPFVAGLIAVSPKNGGVALIERGTASSRVLLYDGVGTLLATPATSAPLSVTITAGRPRAAHFSIDGLTLYVLVEPTTAEPCTGATPPANQIIPIARSGSMGAALAMPSYVADFAVDRTGRLILSEAGANRISVLGHGGMITKLYDATCPTALRIVGDQLFAVTNDTSQAVPDAFTLLRGRVDGSPVTMLPIARPSYTTQLNSSSTRDDLTRLNLQFVSIAVAGQEIAISPDGNRAFISTRSRYLEDGQQPFKFASFTCFATIDIVEYGVHSVDLVSGTSSYESRSQTVVIPKQVLPPLRPDPCVQGTASLVFPPINLVLELDCPPALGDRASGLAAAFSEQP